MPSLMAWKDIDLKELSEEARNNIYVQSYSNGREQGFSVQAGDTRISFAEFRRTDDIAVYIGSFLKFSMQGNVPDEETYRKAEFISSGKSDRATEKMAARYIQEVIVREANAYMKKVEGLMALAREEETKAQAFMKEGRK